MAQQSRSHLASGGIKRQLGPYRIMTATTSAMKLLIFRDIKCGLWQLKDLVTISWRGVRYHITTALMTRGVSEAVYDHVRFLQFTQRSSVPFVVWLSSNLISMTRALSFCLSALAFGVSPEGERDEFREFRAKRSSYSRSFAQSSRMSALASPILLTLGGSAVK